MCKEYIWNPATCSYGNGKHVASILEDSVTTCDEFLDSYDKETKTIPINFDGKKATCKMQIF